jgi:fosfomycin resistance protein FosX
MTIEGISHITFIVKDLERMAVLLSSVLGAKEVYDSGEKQFSLSREKFFLLGGIWIALMEGPSLPDRSYNHIAFTVSESDLEDFRQRLTEAGVDFREGRPRVAGEGQSLYFRDYDNHLFELHTGTLEERLRAYGSSGETTCPEPRELFEGVPKPKEVSEGN